VLTGQSLEMSLTHEDSPPPLTQVEGKVESLDSATYLGMFYLFDLFFLFLKEKKPRCPSTTENPFNSFPYISRLQKHILLCICFDIIPTTGFFCIKCRNFSCQRNEKSRLSIKGIVSVQWSIVGKDWWMVK
jgi:hypothetical protein